MAMTYDLSQEFSKDYYNYLSDITVWRLASFEECQLHAGCAIFFLPQKYMIIFTENTPAIHTLT